MITLLIAEMGLALVLIAVCAVRGATGIAGAVDSRSRLQ